MVGVLNRVCYRVNFFSMQAGKDDDKYEYVVAFSLCMSNERALASVVSWLLGSRPGNGSRNFND